MGRLAWVIAFAAAQVALFATTAFVPGLGGPTWHHNVTLALSLAFVAATWKPFTRDRTFLGLGLLLTLTLATLSGFVLLYLKQDFKDWGLKDWMKLWHILWSWFALWFFLGHAWINRHALLGYWRQVYTRWSSALTYTLALAAIAAAVPLTWSDWGAENLQEPDYVPLTLWTWLVVVAPPYGLWAGIRLWLRGASRPRFLHARNAVRRNVDVWLLPTAFLVNASGFPLLYFGTKHTALKYVAKYWHTAPSIVLSLLLFIHIVQTWHRTQAHWRRFGTV